MQNYNKQIQEHKLMLEIAESNEREYHEFLKKNQLEQSWDTWDMFSEEKWNY
ncbi:hypothetical protein [uncultured Clostridium sp.]|uniref:hypothetical protein n=1 Tax=uncultured Clostridium sp. TaxID=59620 RepID=UPI003216F09D